MNFSYFPNKYLSTEYINQKYGLIKLKSIFEENFSDWLIYEKINRLINFEIFTFFYTPVTKNLPYYDKKPILFVLNSIYTNKEGKNMFNGFNLNYLPTKEKELFFRICDKFLNFDKLPKFGYERIRTKITLSAQKQELIKLLEKSIDNLFFSFHQYFYEETNNLNLIEIEDYKYLVNYENKYFVNAGLSKVLNDYYNNK